MGAFSAGLIDARTSVNVGLPPVLDLDAEFLTILVELSPAENFIHAGWSRCAGGTMLCAAAAGTVFMLLGTLFRASSVGSHDGE
jgi:hypothetical protein